MSRTLAPARPELYEATRLGLLQTPKELRPVWLYDEHGSLLYEEITRLPDYYLPARETEILRSHAGAIAERTPARTLVELGAGNGRRTIPRGLSRPTIRRSRSRSGSVTSSAT